MALRPFVLVHGAWQHAGTWDLVAPRLRELGHPVSAVRLTGLGEDPDELHGGIGLQTHVDDVVAVLERDDLQDVVLVGHSYAGMIITGVADRAAARIACLVYIDAFVPVHGDAALDLLPQHLGRAFADQARAHGGWRLPAGERQLDLWGLEGEPERDFVRARLSDFTIRCFEEPLDAPRKAAAGLRRAYIACVKEGYPARIAFEPFARKAREEGWLQAELPTGHDCHVEMVDAVVALLVESATR